MCRYFIKRLRYVKMVQNIYSEEFTLRTNDVDCYKNIKLSGVLNIFQLVAAQHAELLGCGFENMQANGMFWVLNKLKFKIHRYPRYEEKVIAKTWPKKSGNVYFERDYEIRSESGDALISGTSVWCILSSINHRIVPSKGLNILDIEFCKSNANVSEIQKFKPIGEKIGEYEHVVRRSDLDFNMHVNNTRYADFITDGLECAEISEVQINFMSEGKLGEKLKISYYMEDDSVISVGESADRQIFAAKLCLKK